MEKSEQVEHAGVARVRALARAIGEGRTEDAERLAQEGLDWLAQGQVLEGGEDIDFGVRPVSVAEARSDRTNNAGDWTPRDALLCMLRQIDRGERNPDELMIVTVEERPEGVLDTYYLRAGPSDSFRVAGFLEKVKAKMLAD